MIKVAIIGPESTGKTDLAMALAKVYQAVWVPEFSRQYLTGLNRSYNEDDLLKIAQGQRKQEEELEKSTEKLLISDTEMHVMKVWSEYKYGACHPWILEELDRQDYDLYILAYHDIPYEDDPLREHPDGRPYFFKIYQNLLESKGLPFVVVKGDREKRLKAAKQRIDLLL